MAGEGAIFPASTKGIQQLELDVSLDNPLRSGLSMCEEKETQAQLRKDECAGGTVTAIAPAV